MTMQYCLAGMLVISFLGNIMLFRLMKKKKKLHLTISQQFENTQSEIKNFHEEYQQSIQKCHESELLSKVVRQSPNAIMLMDIEGNIQMINKGFSLMYEYSFEEFISHLGSNYRQTSFSSDVEYRLNWVKENKKAFRYEALNITKNGKELWTQTALVPILNENGNVTHMVTIDTDINQRIIKSDHLISEMESLNTKIDHLASQFKYLENEFNNLFKSISELFNLVERTNEILIFIKEISDETRILGLNASIEASRAGEYGKGFRVITNEIIDISEKTINSIGQIKNIVDSITLKQKELIVSRDDSETRMTAYHQVVTILKKDVREIETAIAEFKSLT